MAMQKPIFMTGRRSDLATLTASSEAGTLFVGNLQDQRPRKVWRTTGTTGITITVQQRSLLPWNFDCLYLGWTNLSAAATIRVQTATTQGGLTGASGADDETFNAFPGGVRPPDDLYPTSIVDPLYEGLPVFKKLANARNKQWVLITIGDAANPSGIIEAGRLMLDTGLQLTRHAVYAPVAGFINADIADRAPSGAVNAAVRSRPRFQEIEFPNMTEDEAMGGLYEIMRLRGTAKDVVFVRDPGTTTHLHRTITQGLLRAGESKLFHRKRQRHGVALRIESFI